MRPIDTIKSRIDSDFTKYHSSNLLKIIADTPIHLKGIGLCVLACPFNEYSETGDPDFTKESENIYPIIIINRPYGWFESSLEKKYYVLSLSPIHERTALSIGFLVSQTAMQDLQFFKNRWYDRQKALLKSNNKNADYAVSDGDKPESSTKENVPNGD